LKKLGQPVPPSNLVSLRMSGALVMGSTKVPGRFSSRCEPVKGRPVPDSKAILRCSGVSRRNPSHFQKRV